jgi:hypothetical protein
VPKKLSASSNPTAPIHIPVALDEACSNFESEVGGRGALIEHLAHAPLTADQQLLVGAIADPRNDPSTLARICITYGIQFADLLTLFRAAGFAKAQLGAMRRVWGKLPDVAGDVMDRAVPHLLLCPTCAGDKEVEKKLIAGSNEDGSPKFTRWTETCETCGGHGEIQVQPKLETQKVALELGGLIQQKGGVEVNVVQQQALVQAASSMRFYQESDEVLYPGQVVEAEAARVLPIGEPEGELVEEED